MATCGAKTKNCRSCGHKYSRAEYELDACPECGEPRPCRLRVTAEGKRCRLHGGKSLKGAASPSFKTGRYSKYLPDRLIERYMEALQDGELLALRDEVALVDVRITQLQARLESGEHISKWMRLFHVYETLVAAREAKDEAATAAALQEIGEIVVSAPEEDSVWQEMIALFDQRRKLVESERKRLVEMRQLFTVEQGMLLIVALVDAVKRHVDDRTVLDAIGDDIRAVAAAQNGGRAIRIEG